jgi:hypothetical protein
LEQEGGHPFDDPPCGPRVAVLVEKQTVHDSTPVVQRPVIQRIGIRTSLHALHPNKHRVAHRTDSYRIPELLLHGRIEAGDVGRPQPFFEVSFVEDRTVEQIADQTCGLAQDERSESVQSPTHPLHGRCEKYWCNYWHSPDVGPSVVLQTSGTHRASTR